MGPGAGPEAGQSYWLHDSRSPDRLIRVAPLAAGLPLRRSSKIHDGGGGGKIENFELVAEVNTVLAAATLSQCYGLLSAMAYHEFVLAQQG